MSQGEVLDLLKAGSMTAPMIEEIVGCNQRCPLRKLLYLKDITKVGDKRDRNKIWYSLNPERFDV